LFKNFKETPGNRTNFGKDYKLRKKIPEKRKNSEKKIDFRTLPEILCL